MWLLLHTIRKSYMGSPTTPLDLTLNDIDRLNLRSLQSLVSCKGAQLGHMLVLAISRKPHMHIGSPVAPSHLTLSDLKGQS